MHALRLFAVLLLAGLYASPVHAAESYDNCTGFVTSLPATLSTQGTWCLKKDLSTSITSGAAITIGNNNVILDCNDFKVGGLAAGVGTITLGIYAIERVNTTVRNCNLRGFQFGMFLYGGRGQLIEDNRIEQSTVTGILVYGDGVTVRRNRVMDTGGRPDSQLSSGIDASFGSVSVTDNRIDGVTVTGSGGFGHVYGIDLNSGPADVTRNFITNLVPATGGHAQGIRGNAVAPSNIHGNTVMNAVTVTGWGIHGGANAACHGNTVSRYSTSTFACTVDVDNTPF